MHKIKLHIKLQLHEHVRGLKGHLFGMASKETPKKLYQVPGSSLIDSASCRLCGTVGNPSHRKDTLKPSNRVLLKIAEQFYGHSIAPDTNLPHGVCRPCERRPKNCFRVSEGHFTNSRGIQTTSAGCMSEMIC